MSKEAASGFLEKARNSSEIQDKITKLSPDASASDLLNLASDFGYQFNEQELAGAYKEEIERQGKGEGELTEADLESVAGGTIVSIPGLTQTIIHKTK